MRAQEPVGTPPPYAVAQVLPVAVQPGVTISAEYTDGLARRILKALEESNRFKTVVQAGDVGATPEALPNGATLRIAPTVTRFVAGNRAERYVIGFGAGATKITVHLAFTDAATSKLLLEQDVKGLIWYGTAFKGFGDPNSAQKDIAKDIKAIVVKHF
ncbi:MAG: DUF4410 domain-containing protein [Acidobacteriota bacterium]|nr:DUF4410 domain-containing protein [Acidobacteriota bacterium]